MPDNEFTDDVRIDDDKAIKFGDSSDFHLEYDSGGNILKITDGTNVLWSLADGGTVGNSVITGTITAGSGSNVLTDATGLIDGGKIQGTTVDTAQLALDAVDATILDETGAYTIASGVVTGAAGLRVNTNIPVEFGSSGEFKILFNATTLEIQDSASNPLMTFLDTGTEVTASITGDLNISDALDVDGNTSLGNADTDTITCTGRMIVRSVTDAGPMTATAGTTAEVVFNTSDSKFYGCTAGGSPATWAAFN